MNIIYLTMEDLTKSAGGKVHFWSIAKELTALGHVVRVLCPKYSREPLRRMKGCEHIPVHQLNAWWKNPFGMMIFEILMVLYLPYLQRRFDIRVFLVRGGGPAMLPWAWFLAARLCRLHIILECNGIAWDELSILNYSGLFSKWTKFSAWQQAKLAHLIVGVTPNITREFLRLAGKPDNAGITIQNGADIERFSGVTGRGKRLALLIPTDALVVGFIGTLTGWYIKGLQYLAQAIENYNRGEQNTKIYLVAYGEGDGRESFLRKYADSPWHIFPGQIQPEEVPQSLEIFNVGVVFSNIHQMHRWGYSPLKFWEYLAAGLPALAFEDTNMGEMIRQNQLGFVLSHNGQEAELQRKISDALHDIVRKHFDGTLSEIGKHNREFVQKDYTWHRAAERLAKNFPTKE